MDPRKRILLMMGGGEKYLLRDDFSNDLAAGSVNGTPAVPGPGTRTVVDTAGNRLSLSGNKIVLANPSSDWGEPALFLDAVVRVAGRMLIAKFSIADTSKYSSIGFYPNNTFTIEPASTTNVLYLSGSMTMFSIKPPAVALYPKSVATYNTAIILRASGFLALIKGDTLTNWTLIGITDLLNTAIMYPGIVDYDNGLNNVDFLRVPVTPWLPTPLASDGFSAAAATDGLGHAEGVAGGIGAGGGGLAWAAAATWSVAGGVTLNTPVLGPEQAVGNLVIGTWYNITATQVNHFYVGCAIGDHFLATAATALDANNKVQAFITAELFRPLDTSLTANVVAQVTNVARTDRTSRGIVIRLDDPVAPTKGIIARYDGLGNISVVEFNGATWTQLFTAVKAWAASDRLQLIADGANIRLIHLTAAGVATLIGSTAAATITTGGYHGLFSTAAGNTLDDFVVYPRGTGGEHNILNKWSA